MRLLVYSLLRVVLVLASAGVLYLFGMRSWLLWVVAVVVGALLSYLLLRPQGRAAAEVIAQLSPLREERPTFSESAQADAAYEDALVDAAERPEPADGAAPAPEGSSTLEREPDAEEDAVPQLEQPGVAQDHDEVAPDRPAEHHPGDAHRPRDEEQHQQRPR